MRDIQAGYPGSNAVFIVDRRYVVKIYAPLCQEDFALETELYPLLSHDRCIPCPRLLEQGVLSDQIDWPYIVMTYIEGQPIREVRSQIEPGEMLKIAHHLGEIIQAIHATPLAPLRSIDVTHAQWVHFLMAQHASLGETFRQKTPLPERAIDEISAFAWQVLQRELQQPLTLVNGDITDDHLLLHRGVAGWSIAGLIDFADARAAAAAYEWPALWVSAFDCDSRSMRACLASYAHEEAPDAGFPERALAYTFLHEFGAEIILDALSRLGNPAVTSLAALQELLWEGLNTARL